MIDFIEANLGRRMSWAFCAAVSCCLLYSAYGQVKEDGFPNDSRPGVEETMALLHKLVAEELGSNGGFLGKTRFTIDLKANTYMYDMSPQPIGLVLSNSDPLSIPLEAMLRTEALRRDLQKSLPTESFWVVSLANVQSSVRKCVESLVQLKDNLAIQANENDCSEKIGEQIKQLDQSIDAFAKDRKLTSIQPVRERSPATGYKVRVSIEPPRARIRYMTLLEYKKCIYAKNSLANQWNDMLEGDMNLIGRYHYLAEWPSELNGPEEGNFEIRQPGTMTFHPGVK